MPTSLESLSERFDSDHLHSKTLSKSDQQQVAKWQRAGDILRRIPIKPVDFAGTLSFSARKRESVSLKSSPSLRRISVVVSTVAICLVAIIVSLVTERQPEWWGLSSPLAPADLSKSVQNYEVILLEGSQTKLGAHDSILTSLDSQGIVSRSADESEQSSTRVIEAQVNSHDLESILRAEGFNAAPNADDLLCRFVASLQTPSKSEVYFGRAVIVVPQEVLEQVHGRRMQLNKRARPKIYVVTSQVNEFESPPENRG